MTRDGVPASAPEVCLLAEDAADPTRRREITPMTGLLKQSDDEATQHDLHKQPYQTKAPAGPDWRADVL